MRIAVGLVIVTLGLWPAQLTAGQPDPPKDKESDTPLDAEFVKVVAASNMAELVAARFGTTRSKKVPVTLFAQRVTADQAKASEELIKLAVKKKIQLPKAMDKKDHDANLKMLSHEGAKFDRAFVERMVNDRRMAITLYENQAKNGTDKDLKAYAEKHLPAFRE